MVASQSLFSINRNYGDNNSFEFEGEVKAASAADAVRRYIAEARLLTVPLRDGQQVYVTSEGGHAVGFLMTLREVPNFVAESAPAGGTNHDC